MQYPSAVSLSTSKNMCDCSCILLHPLSLPIHLLGVCFDNQILFISIKPLDSTILLYNLFSVIVSRFGVSTSSRLSFQARKIIFTFSSPLLSNHLNINTKLIQSQALKFIIIPHPVWPRLPLMLTLCLECTTMALRKA